MAMYKRAYMLGRHDNQNVRSIANKKTLWIKLNTLLFVTVNTELRIQMCW